MSLILFALAVIPTLVESYLDRHGENRTGKQKDTIWLIVVSLAFALVTYLFGVNPVATVAVILGWRILLLDYLVTYLLIKNKVVEWPEAKKWWSYLGKSSKWDRIFSKVDWRVMLVLRVVLFGLATWYFFK